MSSVERRTSLSTYDARYTLSSDNMIIGGLGGYKS